MHNPSLAFSLRTLSLLALLVSYVTYSTLWAQDSLTEAPLDTAMQARMDEADSLRRLYQSDLALEIYEPLLKDAQEAEQWKIVRSCHFGLGSIYADQGQNEWALQAHVKPGLEVNDKYLQSNAQFALLFKQLKTQIFYNAGLISQGISTLTESEKILPEAKEVAIQNKQFSAFQFQKWALFNLGMVLNIRSQQFDKVKSYGQKLLQVVDEIEFGPGMESAFQTVWATYYTNLGEMYVAMEQLDSALLMNEKALNFIGSRQDFIASSILFNLANILAETGHPEAAMAKADSAILVMGSVLGENSPELTKVFILKARLFMQASQPDSARAYLERVLKLRSKDPDKLLLSEGIPPHSSFELEEFTLTALKMLSALELQEADLSAPSSPTSLQKVLEYSEVVKSFVDTLRFSGRLGSKPGYITALDTFATQMDIGIEASFRLAQIETEREKAYFEKSLQFSEANKYNQHLFGILQGQLDQIDGIPPDSLEQEKLIIDQLNYYASSIFFYRNTGASDSLIGELLAWEQKWEDKFQALKKYFKEAHPKYFQLKYGRTPISLDQINRFLTPNQAILEFFVRNNQLTWFLFAQDLAIWEVMELDSDLNQALRDFREGTNTVSAQSNDFERLVRASHRVYQRLLAKPIQALKDHKDQHWRLSIINDGPLHFISWASALPQLPSPNLMNDPSGWDFLVKDRSLTLSQQHSLQIAMATQAPAKDTYENRYGAVGAWYADRDIPEGRKAIEHIIRSEAWANSSEAYLGSPSAPLTASLFWDLGGKSQIFHISGHGLPNWNNPMQSRILLSSTDSITVGDFYQRSLPSRLVILDACEMNLGPAMEGEGVMSFATGIFYAGPPTVLASLWQVEEKASAFLIPAFLDGINEGLAVDVAWQNAQIKFLHEYRGNKHPFYWASITSIGNMAPLYAPGRKRIWLFSGLALVLLLGGWWLWGQRTGAKD